MLQKQSKRKNLIDFFLDNKEAQVYVSTHMFGDALNLTYENDEDDSNINDSIELHNIMNDTFRRNMLQISM